MNALDIEKNIVVCIFYILVFGFHRGKRTQGHGVD